MRKLQSWPFINRGPFVHFYCSRVPIQLRLTTLETKLGGNVEPVWESKNRDYVGGFQETFGSWGKGRIKWQREPPGPRLHECLHSAETVHRFSQSRRLCEVGSRAVNKCPALRTWRFRSETAPSMDGGVSQHKIGSLSLCPCLLFLILVALETSMLWWVIFFLLVCLFNEERNQEIISLREEMMKCFVVNVLEEVDTFV